MGCCGVQTRPPQRHEKRTEDAQRTVVYFGSQVTNGHENLLCASLPLWFSLIDCGKTHRLLLSNRSMLDSRQEHKERKG